MFKPDHNSFKHVEKLTKKIAELLCDVNLIPYNSLAKNGYNRSGSIKTKNFNSTLKKRQIYNILRLELIAKIDAIRVQLRAGNKGANLNYGK